MATPAFIKIKLSGKGITGWPVDTIRYFTYTIADDGTPSCDDAWLLFLSLSPAEKLTRTQADPPAGITEARNCGAGSDIEVLVDNADFVPDSIGGDGTGFDTTYVYSFSGEDYLGNDIISTPAPILVTLSRLKPRLEGNRYSFAHQQALNAFLPRRHPQFTLHPSWKVIFAGSGFGDADDRSALLTRGWSGVAESVGGRINISRSKQAVTVGGFYEVAQLVANSLGSGDARKVWLQEWFSYNGSHALIDNQPAAQAFGAECFNQLQNVDWTNNEPLLAISPNFEVNVPSPRSNNDQNTQWRNMITWFMEGVRTAAQAKGQTPPILLPYDHGSLIPPTLALRDKDQTASGSYTEFDPPIAYDPEPGLPFYLSYKAIDDTFAGGSKLAPLASNTNLATFIKNNGQAAGSQEYMRDVWPDELSMWEKNPDGSKKTRVVKGITLLVPRTDAFRTTINGQQVDILGKGLYFDGEVYGFLESTYQSYTQAIVELVQRAGGKKLPKSTDRQPGWEDLELQQWMRHDAEFKLFDRIQKPDGSGPSINPATGQPYDPAALNKRPVSCLWQGGHLSYHLFMGRDWYRFWMESQPQIATPGANVAGQNYTRASYEACQTAMQRLSELNWIRENPVQYHIPRLPYRNQVRDRAYYDPREEFEKKPVFNFVTCEARADRSNQPYLGLWAQYLAQDPTDQTEIVYWCTDAAGLAITPAYKIRISGRNYVIEDHQIPEAAKNAPSSRWRVQFTDLTGEKQTLTGDYRDARITNHPNPPAFA